MKLKIGPLPNPEKVKILVQVSVELKDDSRSVCAVPLPTRRSESGCGDLDSVHAAVVH